MRKPPLRAFTLIELLVVVTIIVLLIAMLMPAFNKVWAAVRLTQCGTNLNTLFKAYSVRTSDEINGVRSKIDSFWWSGDLIPYLENNSRSLICPESEALPGEDSNVNHPSIDQMFQFKTVGGQTWYTPFAEGTFVIKWSETQEADARAKGYLTEQADNLRGLIDTSYHPDSNKNTYWLNLEDHGGDWDFKDIMVKVSIRGDGTVTLVGCAGSTGHHNYVTDAGGNVVLDVPSMSSGVTYSTRIPGLGSSGDTNYGMNCNASGSADPNGKILLMDYGRYVLYGDDLWTDEDLDPNNTGGSVPIFARHHGQINVLMTDGSISLRDPVELDPRSTTTRLKLWDY